MAFPYKVGFMGAGNMSQTIIKGLIEAKVVPSNHIFASNRTPGKLLKVKDQWNLKTLETNEELVEASDIVILAMKPQDFGRAVDPVASLFLEKQVVISLAAGITIESLQKKLPQCRIARVIPNTPSLIGRGVIGYLLEDVDQGLESIVQDLFTPLGFVIKTDDETQLEGLMISCSSGVGFVYELMNYFQDWVEERGFDSITARRMVVETFLGSSLLAAQQKEASLEDLQQKVTSKKGVTAAGLESMRELEIERLLRYSFEKAGLRNQELAKEG